MKTKEELFNENIGLVYKVINDKFKEFKGTIHHDDIISEGYVSLLRSIDNFDINKGCKFSTFAYMCIYSAINQYVYTKIYQMKKTTKYTEGKKKKTVFLMAEFSYYDSTDSGEDYLKYFEEFDKGYEYVENKLMINSMLIKLKQLENTGRKGYRNLYEIISLKLQGKTTREITKILNITQMTVDRKYKLAIDSLKEYFEVA